MTAFQQSTLLLIALWLVLMVRFRRSGIILIGGLAVIGAYTLAALALHRVSASALGLGTPYSWLITVGFALAGLAVLLAYSPLADGLAGRWFQEQQDLQAFGIIRQARANLILGILAAWVMGGILEELIARGIVLRSIEGRLAAWLGMPLAAAVAIVIAAGGAAFMHSYQGPRAILIIAQISLLFGLLFVLSGHNLWAVMLCHGLYDTIAFVRFARGKSRYAKIEQEKM